MGIGSSVAMQEVTVSCCFLERQINVFFEKYITSTQISPGASDTDPCNCVQAQVTQYVEPVRWPEM